MLDEYSPNHYISTKSLIFIYRESTAHKATCSYPTARAYKSASFRRARGDRELSSSTLHRIADVKEKTCRPFVIPIPAHTFRYSSIPRTFYTRPPRIIDKSGPPYSCRSANTRGKRASPFFRFIHAPFFSYPTVTVFRIGGTHSVTHPRGAFICVRSETHRIFFFGVEKLPSYFSVYTRAFARFVTRVYVRDFSGG